MCQDIAELVVSLKEIQKARSKVKVGLYQGIKKAKSLIKDQEATAPKPEYHKSLLDEKSKLKRYESD